MSDRFPAQVWIGGQLSRTARLYPDDPDDVLHILGDACPELPPELEVFNLST